CTGKPAAASEKETGRIDGTCLTTDRKVLRMLPSDKNSTGRKILFSLLALFLMICVVLSLLAVAAGLLVIWG
ncbi:MAG TPA: hypothetical protein PLY85_02245, partial [Anaerolineaceae bacterium]|nr:hypothetical protein [Anaerolineaceae bacterium]